MISELKPDDIYVWIFQDFWREKIIRIEDFLLKPLKTNIIAQKTSCFERNQTH